MERQHHMEVETVGFGKKLPGFLSESLLLAEWSWADHFTSHLSSFLCTVGNGSAYP